MYLNVLYSWQFLCVSRSLMQMVSESVSNGHRVLIDSGAFSMNMEKSRGLTPRVSLENYTRAAIDHFHGKVWQYVTLDVPRDPVASDINYRKLLDAGLKPMPVYVVGQDLDTVPAMLEHAYDNWICVAGGVSANMSWIAHRYQQAAKVCDGKAKIHALGFCRWPAIFKLPIAAGDSSTWANGMRFGIMSVYNRKTGMKQVVASQVTMLPALVADRLAKCNVPHDLFLDKKTRFGTTGPGTMISIASHLQFMEHAEELGVHLFLAIGSPINHDLLMAVNESRRDDGTFNYPEAVENYKQRRATWAAAPRS